MQEVFEKVGISWQCNVDTEVVHHQAVKIIIKKRVATYQISGITMKQLTEFLNEIDENKRVFTKELDITKSKKIPRAIDVEIKIATMMPKETT